MIDYLGSVQFWWPNVAAADKGDTHTLHELDAAWNNTGKHLQGMVQGEREARYAVEMATVIAGGAEQLRRRPPMSNLIGTVQPLVNDKDGIEAALVFAEAGIPVCFVTMPTYGTTAPATKAGAYVMGFAELVSATVCVQLAHPGAPVILFPLPVHADPRTAALTTAPLNHRGLFLPGELVHHFGLPAMTGYAGTDDDLPGSWLAAAETAHTVMLAGIVGSGADDDHRAHQPLPAVHARAHDARRRPLPARGERVPRPGARRGDAGARRHRRGRPRRALPGAAAHAPAHEGDRRALDRPGDRPGRRAPARRRRGRARARRRHPGALRAGAAGRGEGGGAGEDLRRRGRGARAAEVQTAPARRRTPGCERPQAAWRRQPGSPPGSPPDST